MNVDLCQPDILRNLRVNDLFTLSNTIRKSCNNSCNLRISALVLNVYIYTFKRNGTIFKCRYICVCLFVYIFADYTVPLLRLKY